MTTVKLYRQLATLVHAQENCILSGNAEWFEKHELAIAKLMKHAPRGSGFDKGTQLISSESSSNKLVFETAFHHMNEHGMYDGWTEHIVTVIGDLSLGYRFKSISGTDRNGIKDYIADCFTSFLTTDIEHA